MTEDHERVPPHSIEAEVSVLASMMIDPVAFDEVAAIATDEMFYREANRRIFRTLTAVHEMDGDVDVITLRAALSAADELESVGGDGYLASLIDAVPTAANAASYARVVRDRWARRRVIDAGSELIRGAYDPDTESAEILLAKAEENLTGIGLAGAADGFRRIKESLWPVFETVEKWQEAPGEVTGLPSGYRSLDRLTAGFDPGDLLVFAGRPSMGKTSLILNVAAHLAIREAIPVAISSLEMSREALTLRLLSTQAGVDLQRLKMEKIETEEYQRLAEASGQISTAPIYIDDHPATTVSVLRAKARKLVRREGVQILIIDYMQLIEGGGERSRVEQMSAISRGLKLSAVELNVPIIAVSQLSRGPETRTSSEMNSLSLPSSRTLTVISTIRSSYGSSPVVSRSK